MRFLRFPAIFAILLCFAFAVQAQTPGTGAIRGQVVGSGDTPVAGAEVTVTNEATGFSRTTRADAQGRYTLPELPLTGTYRLRAAHEGLTPQERSGIQLRGGQTAAIDVVLNPAAVEEAITVYGTAEGVGTGSPQLGDRFDAQRIQTTPIIGRKLTALPLLDSAVRSARGTGDLFLNNPLFVINGGGRRQATYTIDGSSADDAWGRQTIFTNIPLAAVQEFTVLTNAFSSEYGRSAGGAINVVTRTGTNDVRGDVVALYRPGNLQADAPVTHQKSHDELKQASGFFSGPFVRDRAYWSLSGEYNDQDRDSIITSPLSPGVYTGHYKQRLLFARADATLNDSNHLFGRFDLDHFTDTNPQDVVGGINLPSAGRDFRRDTEAIQVGETAVLNDSTFNDARFVWQNGDPITQFDPHLSSPQYVRPGVSTQGESRFADLTNRQEQLADTLSLARGDHLLKVGGDYLHSRSGGNGQEFGSPFVLGQFTFRPGISPSIPTSDLTINDVTRFTQGFGNVHYTLTDELWSVFVQDDYRLRSNLMLNLGLRYDRQDLTGDSNNLAPRLGFAWNPKNDSRTTIRGGYGIYFSQIQSNIDAGWELGGPTGFFTFTAAPGQLGFPTNLLPLPAFPPGAVLPPRDIQVRPGRTSFYNQFFDTSKLLGGYPSELENPRTDQATLGGEREFGDHWFLSADGVHAHTTDIPRNLDLNAPSSFVRTAPGQVRPAATADATRPIVPVPNGYRRLLVTVNDGESKYDALQLNLRKNFAANGGMWLSYTWSHTRNNVEPDAPGGDPNDVHQLDKEWADSVLDQRHRAVLSGWVRLPWDLRFGGLAEYATGRPYNFTTGIDNNGDGANTDRPVIDGHVVSRNAGRGNDLYQLTLFLERDFPIGFATLGLRGEVFNVTNHQNVVGYNGVYGNNADGTPLSTFGQPLGGLANTEPGRQYQFQARIRF